jgi:prepilin-type N-terminal cleavage/methylation domain-containing protein
MTMTMTMTKDSRPGFTLIELLVVIAIIAILSVVVILVLNPAELLKQARDSNRLQDLANINTALNLFQTDTGGTIPLGTASTTYVSVPDPVATSTAGDQCQGLGLPSLPTGWSYHCAASSTYRLVNGTGWLPVDLTQISFKSPLALLPVDPVNTTSSGNYYTYIPGGSWALASLFESQRYLKSSASNDGGYDPGRYEVGTDLSLVAKSEGLVGWWTFDEGSGATTSTDSSGNNNNGAWNGSGIHYAAGKVGAWAGQFNGTDDYVSVLNGSTLFSGQSTVSVSFWIKPGPYNLRSIINVGSSGNPFSIENNGASSPAWIFFNNNNAPSMSLTQSVWTHLIAVFDRGTVKGYKDGLLVDTKTNNGSSLGTATGNLEFGRMLWTSSFTYMTFDDVRIYNRALSAAEISATYNATK